MPLVFSPRDHVGAESIQPGWLEARQIRQFPKAGWASLPLPEHCKSGGLLPPRESWGGESMAASTSSNHSSTLRSSPTPHPCPDPPLEEEWAQVEEL